MIAPITDNVRVLVVDDDQGLRNMLIDYLNACGYIASGTSKACEAEDAVLLWGAQVVLLDIVMPGLNGLEITRRLKARDPATQVILMTGYPTVESLAEAKALGADGYLLKPFRNLQSVVEMIERASGDLNDWHANALEALRKEFPEEYRLIYETPAELPDADEIGVLLAQMEQELSPPMPPPA